jgi:hypothetical protein
VPGAGGVHKRSRSRRRALSADRVKTPTLRLLALVRRGGLRIAGQTAEGHLLFRKFCRAPKVLAVSPIPHSAVKSFTVHGLSMCDYKREIDHRWTLGEIADGEPDLGISKLHCG